MSEDIETEPQAQALGPFLRALHPAQRHQNILPHSLEGQDPTKTME